MAEPPTGNRDKLNTADPDAKTTAAKVQQGNTTRNPQAKVPSDLYPDPPGVTDKTPGGKDD
jgi:hypothetical protein